MGNDAFSGFLSSLGPWVCHFDPFWVSRVGSEFVAIAKVGPTPPNSRPDDACAFYSHNTVAGWPPQPSRPVRESGSRHIVECSLNSRTYQILFSIIFKSLLDYHQLFTIPASKGPGYFTLCSIASSCFCAFACLTLSGFFRVRH